MSDGFWRRMAKADISFVALIAVLALTASLLWALRPLQSGAIKMSPEDQANGSRRADNGTPLYKRLALLDDADDFAGTPFSSRYLTDFLREDGTDPEEDLGPRIAAEVVGQHEDDQVPDDETEVDEVAAEDEVEVDVTEIREIEIAYQGMMVRLDRQRMALIESSESHLRGFHPAGAEVGRLTVLEFDRSQMVISDGDRVYTLLRGVPLVIEEVVEQ